MTVWILNDNCVLSPFRKYIFDAVVGGGKEKNLWTIYFEHSEKNHKQLF